MGCGSLEKQRSLNQLISNENFDFYFLQETKLECVNSEDVYSLWGVQDVDCTFKGPTGRVCRCKCDLGGQIFVSVYSSCNVQNKREL